MLVGRPQCLVIFLPSQNPSSLYVDIKRYLVCLQASGKCILTAVHPLNEHTTIYLSILLFIGILKYPSCLLPSIDR